MLKNFNNLLKDSDFSVLLTVFSENPANYSPEEYKQAWLGTIFYGLIHKNLVYPSECNTFIIYQQNSEEVIEICCKPDNFIDELSKIFLDPVSIRIEVTISDYIHPEVSIILIPEETLK